jgi:hypothetical protein
MFLSTLGEVTKVVKVGKVRDIAPISNGPGVLFGVSTPEQLDATQYSSKCDSTK